MPPSDERERVLSALQHAADRIGETNALSYCRMLKRGANGKLLRTYTLTPSHLRVMAAQMAYGRGHIDAKTAMAVLHEVEVRLELDGIPGPTSSLPTRRFTEGEVPLIERKMREYGWS